MDKPQVSVKAIFDQALEIASPMQRAAYLDKVCAESPELRAKVEALLGAYAEVGSFLENPAPAPVATLDSAPEPPDKAAAVSLPSEGPGSRIGPFKLLQKLGEGGMGTVWVAEQTEPVKRRVALKVIKPGMDSRQVQRRFEAERQALAVMDHTHIAKVFGTTAEGRPYFVMELVKDGPVISLPRQAPTAVDT
jgi:serine/threonine-protein kinase